MDWREYITLDPEVCHGKPCFAGTRVMVSVALDNLADGESEASILGSYPSLRAEHLRAALRYAADLARDPILGKIPPPKVV